jgi:hypothetical protein
MSGSEPKEKRRGAMIWFFGIVAVIVFGVTMQDKPITIAASDNPPSISTPVTGSDASGTLMHERANNSGSRPPPIQPGAQIFYGGWSVPQ